MTLAASLDPKNCLSVLVKEENYSDLKDRGLWIQKNNKKRRINARIITRLEEVELVIYAVKSYDMANASGLIKDYKGKIIICQNGLKILNYNFPNKNIVYPMVTSIGAETISLGVSEFKGTGLTYIGNINEKEPLPNNFTNLFRYEFFKVNSVQNIKDYIWCKAVINSAINPIATIYNLKNGDLIQDKYWNKVEELLLESSNVAESEGIIFPNNPLESARDIIEKTPTNMCSMLQDLKKGRRTEIEEINGEICNIGRKNGVQI
ncbi:uncharacterized protein METZ01_LOCUS266530, partial [marine metagenome]